MNTNELSQVVPSENMCKNDCKSETETIDECEQLDSLLKSDPTNSESYSEISEAPESLQDNVLPSTTENYKSSDTENESSAQSDCELSNTLYYNCYMPKDDSNSDTSEEKSHKIRIKNHSNDDFTDENDNQDFQYQKLEFQATIKQLKLELETLKSENFSLMTEISDLNKKFDCQETFYKQQEAKMKSDLLTSTEKLSRENNILRKEKEAIVIRYANSEKEVIMQKKVQQELEKKLKDSSKERETLLTKLKQLSSSVENKTVEVAKLQKDNEKLNSDTNSREVKIKWLQNKLKNEISAHQETHQKLEHTTQRLNEMREEAEQVRKDCHEMIKVYQEAEEIKSFKLDNQLKLKLSELEVQKQEKCDQEQVYILLRQELDALKRKQRMTMDDNNSLTSKINNLEKDRLEYEQTLCKLKDSQNLLNEEVADLTTRLAEMESLKLQLKQETEKSAANLREIERLRSTNADLQSDIDACHVKEGELLEFTEKLTAKTVHLQSEHCLLEIKAQALEDELKEMRKNFADLQKKCLTLETELDSLKKEYENEMQLIVQKLAEKTKIVEKLNVKLDESENENRVLKRRHITSIKELSRELYQYKRRLEMYESRNDIKTETLSLGSRASSTASLDMLNSNENRVHHRTPSPSVTFKKGEKEMSTKEKECSNSQIEIDKEILIEKILVLQQKLVKKNNKIEFLKEHIHHLVKEMNKKTKMVDFKNV